MVCKLIQTDLIAYELGTIEDEGRDRVETHLVSCRDCLDAYLRLKRHLAQGATSTERPSPAVRAHLREAVAASFRPSFGRRLLQWAQLPIPLYQGLATAAVAVAISFATPAILHHQSSTDPLPGLGPDHIDTSRVRPENLKLY